MNIIEAYKAMEQGRRIRRSSWPRTETNIGLVNGIPTYYLGNRLQGSLFVAYFEDVTVDDWVIAE